MNKLKFKNLFGEDVTIAIVDNENEADFITHSGTFHADEVMATCILLNYFKGMRLFRTNEVTNSSAFCYDVGQGKFDHHQAEFNEVRSNGVKYASCGLIWKEYGKKILSDMNVKDVDYLFEEVDKGLIMDIDRDDNGQALEHDILIRKQTLPSIISDFNPSWNETKDENEAFLSAVFLANQVFNNFIRRLFAKEEAKEIIENKINESTGNVLVLDRYMPWKDVVLDSTNKKANDILYAVFPSKRGGYNVVATPVKKGSFDVKKPFPSAWAGLSKEELRKISGVKSINFCHKNLFICACDTYDDALEIARISLEN